MDTSGHIRTYLDILAQVDADWSMVWTGMDRNDRNGAGTVIRTLRTVIRHIGNLFIPERISQILEIPI